VIMQTIITSVVVLLMMPIMFTLFDMVVDIVNIVRRGRKR